MPALNAKSKLDCALERADLRCPPVIYAIALQVIEGGSNSEAQGAITLLINLLESQEADGDIVFEDA